MNLRMLRTLTLAWLFAGALAATASGEVSEIRVGVQPGLTHLPWAVIEHERLIEQRATAAGLGEVRVSWYRIAGGAAMNDAILSASVDMIETGPPSLIVLWDKTRGTYKSLGASGAGPMVLVTRNPDVKTIADFTEKDRIALPAVKTSTQAMILAMAAETVWGVGNHARLDQLTITRAHPDAVAALLHPGSEINSHFSLPPYLNRELAIPGVHAVLDAEEVLGAPLLSGMLLCSQAFRDRNPRSVVASVAALDDALALIRNDPRRAARSYLAVSRENSTENAIAELITAPGMSYERTPRGMMKIAQFMQRVGMIKAAPSTWRELFFEEAHELPGN